MDFSYARNSFCSKFAISSANQGTQCQHLWLLKVVGVFLSFLLCIYLRSDFIKKIEAYIPVFSLRPFVSVTSRTHMQWPVSAEFTSRPEALPAPQIPQFLRKRQ